MDGGFFEKFGNLFREHAVTVENREEEEKRKAAEIYLAVVSAEYSAENENQPKEFIADNEASTDSDNEAKSLASDSEEEKDKTDLISAAFNVSR